MRVGVYQFEGSSNVLKNFKKIEKAIIKASKENIRLLVFQECAICGYPPIECRINDIDFDLINICIQSHN